MMRNTELRVCDLMTLVWHNIS